MSRKKYEIILLVWVLSFVYLLFGALVFNKASLIGITLIVESQIILLIIILLTATYIFPKNWERKRWGLIAIQIIGLNLICVLIKYVMEEEIFVSFLGFPKSQNLNPLFFVYDNFYYSLPSFFIGFITFLIFRTFTIEKRNSELKVSVHEAELNLLKSQINPHFLYNVLNYMYSISLPLSPTLTNTISKLAATMRYTLTKSEVQTSPLNEEIEFVQDYIDLQSTQFDQGIHYNFIRATDNDNIMVPTMVLVTFIENAFKHGIVDDPRFPLKIKITALKNKIEFEIENYINQNLKDPTSGIGLANVKRRLALLLPGKHILQISAENDLYSVHLKMFL